METLRHYVDHQSMPILMTEYKVFSYKHHLTTCITAITAHNKLFVPAPFQLVLI